MSQGKDVVVWEWFDEYHRWKPYSSAVSNKLEEEYQKGSTSLELGQIEHKLRVYTVDFTAKTQIRRQTGMIRKIRRQTYPEDGAVSKGHQWKWESDVAGTYQTYDFEVTEILEDGYKKYKANKKLKIMDLTSVCGLPYVIDFKAMTQTRQHTGRVRPILRQKQHFSPPYYKVKDCDKMAGAGVGRTKSGSVARPKSGSSGASGKSNDSHASLGSSFTGQMIPGFGGQQIISTPTRHTGTGAVTRSQVKSAHHKQALPEGFHPPMALPEGFHPPMALPGGTDKASGSKPKRKIKKVQPRMANMGSFTNTDSTPGFGAVGGVKPKKQRKSHSKDEEFEHVLKSYTSVVGNAPKDEDCCICMTELSEASGHNEDCNAVIKLKCSHLFHKSCLKAMYHSGTEDGSIQCPTCKSIFGVKYGNCPPGHMSYNKHGQSLPGYPQCGLIQVSYNIPQGIQGKEHPNPGQRYVTQGFPRIGFLPDNEEGEKILRLLIKAWQRRLTFTIGTSVTTGLTNAVVWNEIHHKTEIQDHSGHGYPDPNYFSNVTMELASQGVVDSEEEESENEEVEPQRKKEEPESSDDDL